MMVFQFLYKFSSGSSKPQFVDKSGVETLFCIEGVSTGKNISCHSYFKTEDEILLLPGTSLQVRSSIKRADGFQLVHLHRVKSSYELLVPPFDNALSQINSSVPPKNFVQSRSNLSRPLKSKQYNSDDDSSADEAPNF